MFIFFITIINLIVGLYAVDEGLINLPSFIFIFIPVTIGMVLFYNYAKGEVRYCTEEELTQPKPQPQVKKATVNNNMRINKDAFFTLAMEAKSTDDLATVYAARYMAEHGMNPNNMDPKVANEIKELFKISIDSWTQSQS